MKKILISIFLLCVLVSVFGFFHLKSRITTTTLNSKTTIVEIKKGTSVQNVFKILQEAQVFNDDFAFRFYCKIYKPVIKAGIYEIPEKIPLDNLFSILESGKNAVQKVTIPEGRASWEIYSYYKKKFPTLDSLKWESLVHDSKFAKSLNLQSKDLEGYLLPDTYLVPLNANEKMILEQMVKANSKLKEEMEALNSPKWKELGGWHQVLTLASVVEEETGNPAERPLIAGVFHNRLKQNISLGADPTVRFIFRNLTGPIYKSQLNSDSPYNTRKYRGLMPGPISNPGRKAIEATLFPTVTDKLYFVAKDDGSKTHYFSATLSEHNKYKDLAAKTRKKRGLE